MMEFKNCKELSNSEIALYKQELENEFEKMKVKISSMCDELDEIEKEYKNADAELSRRMVTF